MEEIAVVGYNKEGPVCVYDIATGALLTQFKTNQSPANGLIPIGTDHFAAAQPSKGALHLWDWHKDPVTHRSFTPEPIRVLAATREGRYVFGGSSSGMIYAWETSKGQLLTSMPAHYKAITALALSDDGALLLTGGEDALVHVWELYSILDASRPSHDVPRQLHTWSEHMLPISSLACGTGGAHALAVSSALDGKVLVWNLARGTLLKTFTLPAQVLCCALDPCELFVFAGGSDGRLYEAPLTSASSEELRGLDRSAPSSRPATHTSAPFSVLDAQPRDVTCLAVGPAGTSLLAGSADGNVRVYDIESRQCVRTMKAPMGSGGVSGVFAVPTPPYLHSGSGLLVASAAGPSSGAALTSAAASLPLQTQFSGHAPEMLSRKGPKRAQPTAILSKYPSTTADPRPWEGPLVVLEGSALPSVPSAVRSGLAAPNAAVAENLLGQTSAPDLLDCSDAFVRGGMVASTSAVQAPVPGGGGAGVPVSAQAAAAAAAAAAGATAGGDAATVEKMREELATAVAAVEIWKKLHEDLLAKVEAQGGTGPGGEPGTTAGRVAKKAKANNAGPA